MKKTEERGITLIGLVVTIIVLLILAGVTIVALAGDNGILNNATTAKNKTEVATVQELARLTYSKVYADAYANNSPKTKEEAISIVVNKLIEEGYPVESVTSNAITLNDISLNIDGNTIESLNLNSGETKTITISIAQTGSTINYVLIKGMYHKINYDETTESLTIEENGNSELPSGDTQKTITITPSANLAGLVTINGNEVESTPEAIPVTRGTELTIFAKEVSSNVSGNFILTSENSKAYNIIIKKALAVGDEVTYKGDSFYVMKITDSSVDMLAKYCLKISSSDSDTLVEQATDGDFSYSWFSSDTYWQSEFTSSPYNLYEEEPDTTHYATYYAYIYGEKLGGKGRLMYYSEAETLKSLNQYVFCGSYNSSSKKYMTYWLGTASSDWQIYVVNGNSNRYEQLDHSQGKARAIGIRPIITIEKSELTSN